MESKRNIGIEEAKVEELLNSLQEEWIEAFAQWTNQIICEVRRDLKGQPDGLLGKWELKVRDELRPLQEKMLNGIISLVGDDYRGSFYPCRCGGQMHYKRRAKVTIYTLVGKMELERAYYYDQGCGRSKCFLDDRLGIKDSKWSPGIRRIMALVGSDVSFERSSELIWETTGIVISDNSIQRISESVGKELREYEKEQRGKGLLNNVGRTGVKRRIYMEADGGRVPLRESWREVKLGCCFEGEKSPEGGQRGQTRYFGGIYDNLSEFITLWRNEAMYFGVNQEGVELIILRDGAEWIGNQAFEEFPGAVQILDFYHAVEHLGEVAKIVFGEGSEEGKKWVEKFGQRLKEGRLEEVISELEGIRKKKRGAGRVIEQTIAYYQKNASQMEYDKYLEKGYFIGSGVIESGCRHLSNQRLKISGARWIKDNANDILSIRLARANKTWDSYWARFRKSA